MTGLNLVHSKYIIIREAAEFELTTRRFQRFARSNREKREEKQVFPRIHGLHIGRTISRKNQGSKEFVSNAGKISAGRQIRGKKWGRGSFGGSEMTVPPSSMESRLSTLEAGTSE